MREIGNRCEIYFQSLFLCVVICLCLAFIDFSCEKILMYCKNLGLMLVLYALLKYEQAIKEDVGSCSIEVKVKNLIQRNV